MRRTCADLIYFAEPAAWLQSPELDSLTPAQPPPPGTEVAWLGSPSPPNVKEQDLHHTMTGDGAPLRRVASEEFPASGW